MGFFDFLSAPKQDTPSLKKRQGAMPAGTVEEYPKGELPMNTTELWSWEPPEKQSTPSVPDQKAPGVSSGMEPYRSKEADLVKREHRAISEVRNLLNDSPASNDPDVSKVRDALERGTLGPSQLAEDLGILLKNKNLVISGRASGVDVGLHRLVALRNELGAVAEEKANLEASGMPSPTTPQSIPAQELEAEAAEAQKKADQAKLEASRSGSLSRDKKLKEAENWRAQAAALQQRAMEAKGQEEAKDPTSPAAATNALDGDIKKGFASAGVSQKQAAHAVNDGIKAVAESMGADFNPGDAVSFQYALPYAIQALGPEAQLAFSEWLRDVKKKEAEAKGFTPTGNPAQDAGGMQGEKSEGPSNQDLIRQNFEQQRMARAEFAAATELQSWPAIIAFVVLGMLIGPQGAFAFFSNARKKRELQGWLHQLEMERKYLMDEEDHRRSVESETRKLAAARLQHKEDREETWKRQVGMKLLDHKLIIERNQNKNNPETSLMKKLSAEFQRATGMASKFSGEMQNEFADPGNRQKARANFDFYMRKAASLDAQLAELGGDVLEEEPEE